MTIRSLFLRGAALLLSAVALFGCNTLAHSPVERQHKITFDVETDHVDIARDAAGLADLDLFLARKGARYGDRLVVGADADMVETLRQRYAVTGVKVLPAQAVSATETIPVTFSRLLATPPACGDWSEAGETGSENRPTRQFGCAQTANLVRMVADPHDLIAGSVLDANYDSNADLIAVHAYRTRKLSEAEADMSSASTVE